MSTSKSSRRFTQGARYVRRNAVAFAALFFALGGASYAAWLAPANSVNSAAIIDGQVTTPDLAAGAIRADEFCLSGSCVGSREIANAAVSTSELAAGAVGTGQLGSGSVTAAKVAAGAIGTHQLAAGAVGNGQLGSDAVTGDKVKDGSLSAADIAGGIPQAEAFIGRNDTNQWLSVNGTTVVSLNLPAGLYVLTAETSLGNEDIDEQWASCTLSTGAFTRVRIPGRADNGEQSVAVEDLLTLTSPGTASLRCGTYYGFTEQAKLIAVKVGALHG